MDKGVQGQFEKGSDPNITRIRVEVTLGKSAQLPCQCGGENSGEGKFRVQWEDKYGRVVDLSRTPPLGKYALINDKRRLKIKGDCSLYGHRPQQEDQSDYRCSFYDPQFESEGSEIGFRASIVTLVVIDENNNTEVQVVEETRKLATISTLQPRIGQMEEKSTFLALKAIEDTNGLHLTTVVPIKSVNMTQTPDVTFLKLKEEKDVTLSAEVQRTILDVGDDISDFDWTSNDMTDPYHAIQKRDAKWRAYGFDSSVLQIADPWAGRNLWFQQVTHSVRSVKRLNCPCVVKIPSPGTWPSILETVPEPLFATCQSYALSWLLYQQQSARDEVMAWSVHLFRPRLNCSWLGELPYVNLLDQHENMITAVPDASP